MDVDDMAPLIANASATIVLHLTIPEYSGFNTRRVKSVQ